jgi:DNA modification methylase
MPITVPSGVERWPISKLRAYDRNARTHSAEQVAQIVASIKEFGFTNPILVAGDGEIIAGHGRLMAAEQLELREVPVVVLDHLTPEQRRAYVIADNQLALNAGWDDELLRAELTALDDVGFDLSLVGFSDEELAGLLDVEQLDAEEQGDADAVPEPPAEPVTKPGDVWLLGKHRVMCGDSTVLTDVERLLCGESVALVMADPPYFAKVDADWDNDFDGYEGFLDFLRSVFSTWAPSLMDRGTAGWWCAPDFAWHIEGLLREHFAIFNHIVWHKGQSLGTTVCVKDMRRWRPRSERLLLCEKQHSPDALLASFNAKTAHIAARSAYENIIDRLIGWQKEAKLSLKEIDQCLGKNGMAGHYFGRSQWALPTEDAWGKLRPLFASRGVDIGEFDAQRSEFDAQRSEFDAQRSEFDAQRREFDAQKGLNLTDVWEMSAPVGEERHGHPTPKPVAMISKLVSAHSRTEDLVADPFLGSGTTLIASEQLGRKCYGMEISPQYCDVIVNRWQQFTGKTATLEATGKPFPSVE